MSGYVSHTSSARTAQNHMPLFSVSHLRGAGSPAHDGRGLGWMSVWLHRDVTRCRSVSHSWLRLQKFHFYFNLLSNTFKCPLISLALNLSKVNLQAFRSFNKKKKCPTFVESSVVFSNVMFFYFYFCFSVFSITSEYFGVLNY